MPRGPTAGTKRQRAKPSATKQQDADAKESEPVVVQESGETDGLGALELGQAEDFLLPDAQRASVMKHATKRLFDFARLEERNKTGGRSAGPLDELHLDGFDTEQIWHMLELYNTPLVQTASRKLEQLLSDTHGDISLLPEQSNLFQNAKQMKLPPGVKATEPQQQRQQPKQQQEQQQQQQQQQQKQQEQHLLSDDEDDDDDDNDDDDDDDDDGNTGRKSKGTTAMKVVEQQRAAKTKAKAKGKAKDGDGDAGRGVIEEEEEDGFVRRRRVLAAATKTQQSKSTSAPAKHAMAVDTPAGKRGGKASDSDDNNDESEESDGAGWELGVDLTQELESDDEAREARYEDFFDPPEVIAAREARMAARRQKRQEQRAAERAARRAMKSKSKAAPHDYSDGDDDDDDDDDSDEEDELRADFDPDDDDMIDDGDDSDDDDDNMDVEVDSDDDDGGATHKNNKTQTPNTKRKKKKKSGSGAAALFGDEDWDDGGGGDHDGGDDDDEDEEKDSGADGEDADDQFGHTRHAERLERMKRKISEIEAEHLNPDKHWTLTGEVRGKQRPQNSLLEAALEYEQASKMVPVITEQTTQSLEQLIARRVCDGAFDDPVRKDPPSAEDLRKPFRPKVVLDDKKSSKSLAEIYEKEFIDKRDNVSEFAAVDSQVNEQHQKLDAMVKRLFSSLDALSNFHFTPRPVALEVTVTSVPALAVEEAIPIAVSDAARLAPEELFAKPKELPKGENERTQAERKQSHAAKKRVKAREKRQREANEKLADKLGRGNKHSKAKALKELEAAIGAGGKTRITIAGRGADAAATPKYGKSASFFGELQNQLQTAVADARAGKKDSGAKQPKPPQKTTQNAPPPGPKAQRKSNQE